VESSYTSGGCEPVELPERYRSRMRISGPRRFVTLTSWVVILTNPLPILAFAGSEQDLQTPTAIPRQTEAQPTSAPSLVLQPASVAFPIPSTLASSTLEQAGEAQVANDSLNDGTPENNNEPRRRALPAPLDSIFPSSEYLGPSFDRCARYGPDLPPSRRRCGPLFLRSKEPTLRCMVGRI